MRERIVFSTNSARTNASSYGKNKPDPYLIPIVKLNLKWFKYPNVKAKTIRR